MEFYSIDRKPQDGDNEQDYAPIQTHQQLIEIRAKTKKAADSIKRLLRERGY